MTATTPQMSVHEKALHCTIVSFIPWPLHEFKPGLMPGHFHINASDTKTPTCIYIANKTIHYVYLDDTRGSLPARDPSDEVARSIVQDYVASQLGVDEGARPGIFWVPGYHTPEEILKNFEDMCKEIKSAQTNWFLNLARIADDDWTRYRKHNVISDFQRVAASLINWSPEDHEWMRAAIKQKDLEGPPTKQCIACRQHIDLEAVVCNFCKCIVDPEKATKMGIKFSV